MKRDPPDFFFYQALRLWVVWMWMWGAVVVGVVMTQVWAQPQFPTYIPAHLLHPVLFKTKTSAEKKSPFRLTLKTGEKDGSQRLLSAWDDDDGSSWQECRPPSIAPWHSRWRLPASIQLKHPVLSLSILTSLHALSHWHVQSLAEACPESKVTTRNGRRPP